MRNKHMTMPTSAPSSSLFRALSLALPLLAAGCMSSSAPPTSSLSETNQPVGAGVNVQAGTAEDFIVNVGRRTFFSEGSTALDGSAEETLSLQANWLTRYTKYKVRIQGHADEKGTADYNKKLSAQRADAVKAFLVAKGVEGGRISVQGVGNTRPQLRCADISCWSQNRRVLTQLQ